MSKRLKVAVDLAWAPLPYREGMPGLRILNADRSGPPRTEKNENIELEGFRGNYSDTLGMWAVNGPAHS